MSLENEPQPGNDLPSDPEQREQMKRVLQSDEEIIEDLREQMDRPLTREELKESHDAKETVDGYRAAREQAEQERIEAESLEGQIAQVVSDLDDLYENLSRRLKDVAEDGHLDEAEQYQNMADMEWAALQNEIKAATPVTGMWGARSVVPESKRRELLGALKHSMNVLSELKKLVNPSESGQE